MKLLSDLIDLKGRRALVTGAAGGIGRHIALTIAELGGDLILVDQPGTEFKPLLTALADIADGEVECIPCDLEFDSDRHEMITRLRSLENLDILINNAAFVGTSGLDGWVTDFENQSVDTFRRALEVNLTAAFDLTKGLKPLLEKNGVGSIINMASIYGVHGPDYSLYEDTEMGNPAAYSSSKGGLIQLTRWLATTLAPNIRVNAVSPGGVFRNQPRQFVSRYKARTPLKRMAQEEDFKGVIAFLASDMSSYVTGQNIHVDGGWGVW